MHVKFQLNRDRFVKTVNTKNLIKLHKFATCNSNFEKSLHFFGKKIYFHKTNLQKNHTYNTKHTICKRKEMKAKKRLEISDMHYPTPDI